MNNSWPIEGDIFDECIPSVEDRAKIRDIENRHIDAVIGEWNNYFSLSDSDLLKSLNEFETTAKRKLR